MSRPNLQKIGQENGPHGAKITGLSVAAVLAVAAAFFAGCGGNNDGPSGLELDWGLRYVGGGAVSCVDAGAAFVDVDAQNLQNTASAFHERFNCALGTGVSGLIPGGAYAVSIRLRNAALQILNEVPPLNVQIARSGKTDLGTGTFDVQSFVLNWSVSRMDIGITCAQAGAATVELITQLGEEDPVRYKYACADRMGSTIAVLLGAYSVQVRLLDAMDKQLSATKAMTFPVTLSARAILPPVTFSID